MHIDAVKKLEEILLTDATRESKEAELANILLQNGYHERKRQEALMEVHPDKKKLRRSYHKKGDRWKRTLVEYDFETVGWELGEKFATHSYRKAFADNHAFADFIAEHQRMTPLLLEQMVYARAPIDEEDQDSVLLQMDQDRESRLWEAHALACLMLFKADTLDAFKKGIEIVDDIEIDMSDFYEKWEKDNVMPEYRF